jgi:hypothetical protein
MHKKVVLGLAVILVLTVAFAAQAALQENRYLPLVYRQIPTATSTVTVTLTPTPTTTPTSTKTPTPTKTPDTPCLSLKTSGVCITDIDYKPATGGPLNEFISLKNLGSSAKSLKDWRISSDTGHIYDILVEFSLGSSATVKVWTKSGDNDSDEIFMDRTEEFWKDNGDCAYLHDDEGDLVDAICFPDEDGLFYVPAPDRIP